MGIFSRNLLNTPKVPHFSPQILIHFSNMNQEKLKQLQAQVRIGGKGTARRKKKFVHRTATTDDKKLQSSLKKLSVNNIPGIEEVNMIKDDGTVIHFNNPKVQASLAANTFAVTGHGENKQITDLLPGILNQLGAESLTHLKKLASNVPTVDGMDDAGNDADDDDDVPDLVENFDEASKNEAKEEVTEDKVEEVVEKVEELKVEEPPVDKVEEAPPAEPPLVEKVEDVVKKVEEAPPAEPPVVEKVEEAPPAEPSVVDKVEEVVEKVEEVVEKVEEVVEKVEVVAEKVEEVVEKVETPKIEEDKTETKEE